MTKIFGLWDHECEGSKKLAEQKILYFEGYGCWCSPIERNYKMDWGDKTYDVIYCPCCGERMKPRNPTRIFISTPKLEESYFQKLFVENA